MSYDLIINHWKNMDCNDFIMYITYNSKFFIYDIYEDKCDTFDELKTKFLNTYNLSQEWNPELNKKCYNVCNSITTEYLELSYYTSELADSFIERLMMKKPFHKILYILIKEK